VSTTVDESAAPQAPGVWSRPVVRRGDRIFSGATVASGALNSMVPRRQLS